ncbi:hypothetical protein [Saccharopolyspora elongata]|uniref:DUF4913 domain-containing protein n=1 Tax=Saccharopolyspora elongata TaxID=2530387 RepID=A0A4R4Y161_9PSEU|nr:hypothetical protein [Saccharopolyspora elongata]TDD37783.1 hypothetical protein E1288_39970 [Saccharopolyspora elongata]
MTDEEIPEPQALEPDDATSDQQDELHAILTEVIQRLRATETKVQDLERAFGEVMQEETRKRSEPAPWVWVPPPATTNDPRTNVRAFVEFYNLTYFGAGRAQRIPECWEQHPGLAMEIATLAAAWRAANLGRSAHPRDAQSWHHHWRPGAIDRMVRDWTHPSCLDGDHRPAGADSRVDRFTAAEHTDTTAG